MNRPLLCSVALIMLLSCGCGTLKTGRGWGEDAFSSRSLKRIPQAFYRALLDWQTLLPAAGALVFTIDHFDARVADWAVRNHPVFGSERAAKRTSDYFYIGLYSETLLTAMATPSGNNPKDWAAAKLKGLAVEGLALGTTAGITTAIKEAANREIFGGGVRQSFPSGHTSAVFASVTLSNHNLNSIEMPERLRLSIQTANVILAAGTAVARIEGKSHYPSDVLAGAALGHFFSAFLHDVFLGYPEELGWGVSLSPVRGGAVGHVFFTF